MYVCELFLQKTGKEEKEAQAWLSAVLCSSSHVAAIKVFLSGHLAGEEMFPDLIRLLAECISSRV